MSMHEYNNAAANWWQANYGRVDLSKNQTRVISSALTYDDALGEKGP